DEGTVIGFRFRQGGLILMQLLALPGKFLGFVDPLLLSLKEVQLGRGIVLQKFLEDFGTFCLHGHRRLKPANILLGLILRRFSLIDEVLCCSDSGLILGKLIAKELALQQYMLWIAIGRGFERRLAGNQRA